MKTGLTKRQKTTCIYFDEASKTVEIQTHNTALKKRHEGSAQARKALDYTTFKKQKDSDEMVFFISYAVARYPCRYSNLPLRSPHSLWLHASRV